MMLKFLAQDKFLIRFMLVISLFINLSLAAQEGSNSTKGIRYITDELKVNLRAGPGIKFKILKTLRSRNKVTFLTSDKGWSRVDFNGAVGWVPSQYLIFTSTALINPDQTRFNLKDKVNFQNSQDIIEIQQQAISRLGLENKSLLIAKNKLYRAYKSLKKLSQSAQEMKKEQGKLFARIVESKNRYQLLENVYASSTDAATKKWLFISIIGSVIAFILGIIVTYIKRKKRRLY